MSVLKLKDGSGNWNVIPALKGDAGPGVASGGTQGQILKKSSSTDYDTEWVDIDTVAGNDFVYKTAIEDAGITNKTYTEQLGGQFSVTTATASGYIKPYARASVTGRFDKHSMYRVTFNGTQYIIPCRLWFSRGTNTIKVYEYLGNLGLYISDVSGIPDGTGNQSFVIISDLNNSNSIDVLTNSAGTYTILIEKITETKKVLPKSLIYDDYYVPFQKKNGSGSTYNGFSIGINELKSTRATTALGYANTISNEFSTVNGICNDVASQNTIVIGNYNTSNNSGFNKIAIGFSNTLNGGGAITIGDSCEATNNSWAIGEHAIANGTYMLALGRNNVLASKDFQNYQANTFYKKGDIVKGLYMQQMSAVLTMICLKDHTSANSQYLIDDKEPETNILYWSLLPGDSDTLVAFGNGSTARSNAVKYDWLGNGYFGGDIYVNCESDSTGGTKLATVDDIPTDVYDLDSGTPLPANASLEDYTTLGVYYADSNVASTISDAPVNQPFKMIVEHTVGDYGKQIIIPAYGGCYERLIDFHSGDALEWTKLISNEDYATTSEYGVIKIGNGFISSDGILNVEYASATNIKAGATQYKSINPYNQHQSVFYGLAKAAGDTTQAQSSNAVGTYTNEAKSAIQTMLGISNPQRGVDYWTAADQAAIVSAVRDVTEVAVSGTDPVITANANTRYTCGEVLTLSFTPCASGTCDVMFTSGTTTTLLTLPSTVKMPEWFEVESGYTYEISITDGVYGAVMSWPL